MAVGSYGILAFAKAAVACCCSSNAKPVTAVMLKCASRTSWVDSTMTSPNRGQTAVTHGKQRRRHPQTMWRNIYAVCAGLPPARRATALSCHFIKMSSSHKAVRLLQQFKDSSKAGISPCKQMTHPTFSIGSSHTSSSMLPPVAPAACRIKAGFGPRLYISAASGANHTVLCV